MQGEEAVKKELPRYERKKGCRDANEEVERKMKS